MYGKMIFPAHLFPEELDQYLEEAWFRMGQSIFTCAFLNFNSQFYDAIWLRLLVSGIEEDKTFLKLKKINSGFQVVVQEACLNEEKEALYQKYRLHVPFSPCESLQDLLYGQEETSIYHTYEICLYHGEKLIGLGFFDLGKHSAAGISACYDPDYKKYSIGKFLIYSKIEYCHRLGLRYFYPGYFAPGYRMFDYKLEIRNADLEYFDLVSTTWKPIQEFSFERSPLQQLRSSLQALQQTLLRHQKPSEFCTYEFYNCNLVHEFYGLDLYDSPMFIIPGGPETMHKCYPILHYNLLDNSYELLHRKGLYKFEGTHSPDGNYWRYLFSTTEVLYKASSLEEFTERIIHIDPLFNSTLYF
jgi:arginine-tRNA-protein transferase